MSKLKYFLSDRAEKVKPKEVVVSQRYKDEDGNPVAFLIKPISTEKEEEIKKKFTEGLSINFESYKNELMCQCIVEPDLKSVELQDSYGVSDDISLLKQILFLPGEREELFRQVQLINGYDLDFSKLVKNAKN
ncbi:MAG: phage tail assembly chaperone [Filifactoraceae bacterium]